MQDAGEVPVLLPLVPTLGQTRRMARARAPSGGGGRFTGRWSAGSSLAWVGAAGSC